MIHRASRAKRLETTTHKPKKPGVLNSSQPTVTDQFEPGSRESKSSCSRPRVDGSRVEKAGPEQRTKLPDDPELIALLGSSKIYDDAFDEVEMHFHPEYYRPGGLRYTPGLDDPISSPDGQAWIIAHPSPFESWLVPGR